MNKRITIIICAIYIISLLCVTNVFARTDFQPTWPLRSGFNISALDYYQSGKEHSGIDIGHGNKTTQDVYAVANGIITNIGNKCSHHDQYPHSAVKCDANNLGNFVTIKHTVNGKVFYSQYGHLTKNSITVNVGDSVTSDTKIGNMGSSGNSTGPHLHLAIYEGEYTKSKVAKTFDFYKDNVELMRTLRIRKKLASKSSAYGDWIKENGTLNGDLYYFNDYKKNVEVVDNIESSNDSEDDGDNKTKTCWWHMSYDSKGYCKSCGTEYDMNIKNMSATTYQAVKNDVPVRNRPYSPEKITKYLSKGTKVTVVASGKNSARNLWYKLDDGSWIYSKNLEEVKEVVCKHKYNDRGYCKNCNVEYSISTSSLKGTYQAVKDDVPVRNRPYAPEKITKWLSKGTKVNVIASGKNSEGNLWYKLDNGSWIYSKNLEKAKTDTETLTPPTKKIVPTFEIESIPKGNLPYGKDFTLKGWFRSDSAIAETRAYILDENKNVVMQSDAASSTTSNYKIEGYKLDKGIKFDQLSPGGYYLKYYVKDADGDTSTWVSDKFYIAKDTPAEVKPVTPTTQSTSIRFEIESMPKGNLPYGKSFSLKGWFRSDSPIVEARAYMLDANKNVVMQSDPASSTTSNYKIQGYKLDKAMKFNQLNPGGYYLKFFVRDADGDTFTWISDKFYIVK